MRRKLRALWRPKLPEAPAQCVSCPFHDGNDEALGKVLSRLSVKHGQPANMTPARIAFARAQVLSDIEHCGDFVCHGTVYGPGMELLPPSGRRQCPGATKRFKESES